MARGQSAAARSNAKKGKKSASNKATSSTAKTTATTRKEVSHNTAVDNRAGNASALLPEDSQ